MDKKKIPPTSLTEAEALDRLSGYDDAAITTELRDLGKMLISEGMAQFSRLDSKASQFAAYSIGMITLLVSTNQGWVGRTHSILIPIPIWAAVFALISASLAIWSLAVRQIAWLSQKDWMTEAALKPTAESPGGNLEKLKRSHVLAMHAVLVSQSSAIDAKGRWVLMSQGALLVAAILLVVALFDRLWMVGLAY